MHSKKGENLGTEVAYPTIRTMLFVATCTFVMYQKVHLLLNNIVVVVVEDVCELRKCIEHRSTFQNYTIVTSSMEVHTNNCTVLIN